jgi:hypothetical protein
MGRTERMEQGAFSRHGFRWAMLAFSNRDAKITFVKCFCMGRTERMEQGAFSRHGIRWAMLAFSNRDAKITFVMACVWAEQKEWSKGRLADTAFVGRCWHLAQEMQR